MNFNLDEVQLAFEGSDWDVRIEVHVHDKDSDGEVFLSSYKEFRHLHCGYQMTYSRRWYDDQLCILDFTHRCFFISFTYCV